MEELNKIHELFKVQKDRFWNDPDNVGKETGLLFFMVHYDGYDFIDLKTVMFDECDDYFDRYGNLMDDYLTSKLSFRGEFTPNGMPRFDAILNDEDKAELAERVRVHHQTFE